MDEAGTPTAVDGLPSEIPFATIRETLTTLLGVPVDDLISVTFGVDAITVERARKMADGKWLAAGREIATATTIIGYKRDEPTMTDAPPPHDGEVCQHRDCLCGHIECDHEPDCWICGQRGLECLTLRPDEAQAWL